MPVRLKPKALGRISETPKTSDGWIPKTTRMPTITERK